MLHLREGALAPLAARQHRSLSAVAADLTLRGLAQLDSPVALSIDPKSGHPVLSVGRTVTSDDVAVALDDE